MELNKIEIIRVLISIHFFLSTHNIITHDIQIHHRITWYEKIAKNQTQKIKNLQ